MIKKVEKVAKKAEVKSGKVYSATGSFVREYTAEQSDENKTYLEKAKGYAEKIGGTVR